ncbi:MAG: FadR family transcriptional regulator [Pseudomonadota bacterium]|nr:FadR family transcriptional regulator [Pseudomonadota bacterium]
MATGGAQRTALSELGLAIVSGRHAAGASLPPEAELGEALGVSRTVVREVVKTLVAKGLISTGPKVGTRVLPAESWNWFDPEVMAWQARTGLSKPLLRDLQELRRALEPVGARLAAERATAEDLADLQAAYDGMHQAVHHGGDYVSHDLRFHQTLLRASHNRLVIQMSKAIGALLRTSFEISTIKPDGTLLSLPSHRAVLDAVLAHDAPRAEAASTALIDHASADIEAVLASRRRLPSLAQPAAVLKARKNGRHTSP